MSQMGQSMTSSMGSSMTSSTFQPKSSIKKNSNKKMSTNVGFNGVKTSDIEYPGYNKLRLDSAVSPKHQQKNKAAQSPRNYVLEKNWQNSIQNGNFCPQYDDNKYNETCDKPTPNNYNSLGRNAKTANSNMSGSLTAINMNSNKIVARNLHSNIVFDSKTSYSDGENVNNVQSTIGETKKTTSDTISDNKNTNGIPNSPGGTLKRNKNIKNTIFRSKSGSNVPTCFDDSNYDSFDDSQIDIYEYSKENGDENKYVSADCKVNPNSGISTPEVCDKYEKTTSIQIVFKMSVFQLYFIFRRVQANDDITECPFCLMSITEGALDIHYWRTCPLLCRCVACRAPLEVRVLNQHLIGMKNTIWFSWNTSKNAKFEFQRIVLIVVVIVNVIVARKLLKLKIIKDISPIMIVSVRNDLILSFVHKSFHIAKIR